MAFWDGLFPKTIKENSPVTIIGLGKNLITEQFGKAEERIDINISKEIG